VYERPGDKLGRLVFGRVAGCVISRKAIFSKNFPLPRHLTRSKIRPLILPSGRVGTLMGGFSMEQRAHADSSASATKASQTQHEGRNVWVLTAYGISGLALFGVLAYYFSSYITR
jgi:hypothetical protein